MNKVILDNQFSDKFELLPDEVKLYFSSEINGKNVLELAKEYKVEDYQIYSLVFLAVNSDFDLEILKDRIKKMELTGISAKKLWIDFLGRILLPIEKLLEAQFPDKIKIEAEIKRLGTNPIRYKNQIEEVIDLIDDENVRLLEELITNFEASVDIKEEEDYVTDILKNDLLSIFKTSSLSANTALNRGFIYLLFNAEGFKESALRIIMSSQSLIGKNNILMDGREVAPSVANWLKNFIKEKGSDMFDDIVLAQYLDNNNGAKQLSQEEKEILSSLLRFYKNINFFPESMQNIAPDKWQIFPFEVPIDSISQPEKKVINDVLEEDSEPKKDEIKQDEIKQESLNIAIAPEKTLSFDDKKEDENNNVESFIKSEEKELNLDEENLLNLKKALNKYQPLSLEYKAISAEIRRLENK